MREETWAELYRPIKNHLDSNASWNGEMFETYGDELAFVQEQDYHLIWTYTETDGASYLVNGRAFVNRIGFFVCEVPWIDGENFTIKVEF
jgi:hypothetical protein